MIYFGKRSLMKQILSSYAKTLLTFTPERSSEHSVVETIWAKHPLQTLVLSGIQ